MPKKAIKSKSDFALKSNVKPTKEDAKAELMEFEKKINELSKEDLKDLLLINTYKLALTRAQLDAVIEILIKEKLITYEEFWKKTNEILKDLKLK